MNVNLVFYVNPEFYDREGKYEEHNITADNMKQLQFKADCIASDIARGWGLPVKWRKRNKTEEDVIALKVKIEDEADPQFEDFLNEEGLFFQKVRYTKSLFLWRVDVPSAYEIGKIKKLPFVLSVAEMNTIIMD